MTKPPRIPKGARLRTATKLPKRELIRRLKAAAKQIPQRPEPYDFPLCPLCRCPINECHRDGCCALKKG